MAFVWAVAGVGRSFGTLPLSVPVALLPPLEQAYENPSSITLISFGIGHCWGSEKINSYHSKIGCVGTAVRRLYDLLNILLYRYNIQNSGGSALLWAT
jgi:hypothetical protein